MVNHITINRYIKPIKIYGNLYFVGTRAVCTHLIDTGEGLIIIDPGCSENLPIVLDNIVELGFNVNDIKYIVVTHAHYDHMDSVSELVKICGAKTFIGKGDLPLLTGEMYHYPIKPFKPDVLLNDGDIISLGNTEICCVSTPGHTEGTMSFFFNVTDGSISYRAGLFGGVGSNTLLKQFLLEHNISPCCRQMMLDSINKLKGERIDIFLGNHLQDNKTEEKIQLIIAGKENPFIANAQYEWNVFLDTRLSLIKQIIEEDL